MKSFIKDSASGIIATVIGGLILVGFGVTSDDVKNWLAAKSLNNLVLIIFSIIMLSIIINLLSRLKHKNKELFQKEKEIEEMTGLTENYAEKKGFKLYKNFAYYKQELGTATLYCKPCLDDRKQERVLQKISTSAYQCNSCNKLALDFEQREITHKEANQRRRETSL